jgi:hypothetical protein
MSLVANLLIDDDTVTVELTVMEKAEAVHGNLRIPRSAITGYWSVPDGLAEVPGFKLAGAGLPGSLKVGTWTGEGKRTFAVCHGASPAVVLELTGERYDRVVVTVENPEDVIAGLR